MLMVILKQLKHNNNESIEEKIFRLVKKEDIIFSWRKSYSKMIEMTEEIGKHEN
jgi:hypothetical protein